MLKTLLSVVLSGAALLAQGEPEVAFNKTFGREGDPGSFRVRFSRAGGGIAFLQLMDHWASVEASKNDPHDVNDYMLLGWNQGNHGLRLVGRGTQTGFPEDVDLGTVEWQYRDLGDAVEFTLASGDGLELRRTLRHDPAQRGFVLEIGLKNTGEKTGQVQFELLGLALTNPAHTTLVGMSSIAIAAPVGDGEPSHVVPQAGTIQPILELDPHQISFAGNTSRFFCAFLSPRNETARTVLTGLRADTGPLGVDDHAPVNSVARMRYTMAFPVPATDSETVAEFDLYLGPKSYRVFETLPDPERYAPVLEVDLAGGCFCEVPGQRAMAKLLLSLMGWFYDLVANWGVAIIMLTVLVRGLLAPLNFHMQRSMRKYSSKMVVLKPKLDALKEQYADDPKAYQQAMIAFQRENKIMPPLGGCLPILLTMPVYIGLFTALRTAYDLRQQPFMLWIHDLSLSDSLFLLPFWPGAFNLLPLLWMALFLYMALRQPLPTDPQQRSVQRMMRIMPLVMGVLLYGYASALLLYMVTSMVWSLGESAVVKKILGPVDPNVASMTPTPM